MKLNVGGNRFDSSCAAHRPLVSAYVLGRIFYTTLSTLTREKDSMLAAMFGGDFMPWRDEQGCFFIDRYVTLLYLSLRSMQF